MNDSHDNEAAGRVRGFLDWQDDGDLIASAYDENEGVRTLEVDDLRAVLAENKTMRQQLAGLKTEWEVRVERPGRPRTQGTFNAAVIAHGAADAMQQGEPDATISVHSRLVGEWQPAERDE